MQRSATPTREIEVKYRVDDHTETVLALQRKGIQLGEPIIQDDQAYAPNGWMYGDSTMGVSFARLRTVADVHTFTVKRPVENSLSCEEHETAVSDRAQMHTALLAMGYYETVRIHKTRRAAFTPMFSICLDEVEGIGPFIELEWCAGNCDAAKFAQAEMADFVTSLSITAERTDQPYDALVRAATLVH